jgi:hypothetical protein
LFLHGGNNIHPLRTRCPDRGEAIKKRSGSELPQPSSPGIKIATVARQLGVSRSWASREANAPGTRMLIAELLASYRERLSAPFDKKLDVTKDAFRARKIFVVRGALVDGGPDHNARLAAAKPVLRLTSSRRSTTASTEPPGVRAADVGRRCESRRGDGDHRLRRPVLYQPT